MSVKWVLSEMKSFKSQVELPPLKNGDKIRQLRKKLAELAQVEKAPDMDHLAFCCFAGLERMLGSEIAPLSVLFQAATASFLLCFR